MLTNGKVLIAARNNGSYMESAELYDPSTGTWASTGNMNYARYAHTASLLTNGNVIVTGGEDYNGCLNSAELYQP